MSRRANKKELVDSFNKGVEHAADMSKEIIKEEIEKSMKEGFTCGVKFATEEMLVIFLSLMHINHGYGEKRLRKILSDIKEHWGNTEEYKIMLKDKYGIDITCL